MFLGTFRPSYIDAQNLLALLGSYSRPRDWVRLNLFHRWLYTERDSKIGIWQGCGHLKKLGGSSFFKGSRPEFEPGLAGAEAAKLNKFSDAGGTQIQWLPDAARTDFSITSGIMLCCCIIDVKLNYLSWVI